MAKMPSTARPSQGLYRSLVVAFLLYSLLAGYYLSTRPAGKWRSPFSWHPLLMILGLIGCAGVSAVTKKMGGYANTKNHGILAMVGGMLACGGLYAIYINKDMYERPHFTSYHGKVGLALVASSMGVGLVGAVFLHPDFGVDKTNQQIRKAHKLFARFVLGCAWATAFQGMTKVTGDFTTLALLGIPLLLLLPFTLL